MKSLKYLTILIGIANIFTVPSISQAQSNQTLGQCMTDVINSSRGFINSKDAA